MTQPQENITPPAGHLDYQRADKIFAGSCSGLMRIATFVLLIGIFFGLGGFGIYYYGESRGDRLLDLFIFILCGVLPFLWCLCYFIAAVLVGRRKRWACWVAFYMSVVNFAVPCVWAIFIATGVIQLSNFGSAGYFTIVLVLLGIMALGCAAVAYELWKALRQPLIWKSGEISF